MNNERLFNDYSYAQCDPDDEDTIIFIQQAEAAAELEAAKQAVVNMYLDGNTGEVLTVCYNCFTGNEEAMKDLSYIDKAGDWDICGCCGIAQNIPAYYHGEI